MISKIFCKKDTSALEILKIFEDSKKHELASDLAMVVDNYNRLLGTVTSGDIRRGILLKNSLNFTAADVMESNPIVFDNNLKTNEVLDQLPLELSKRNRKSQSF